MTPTTTPRAERHFFLLRPEEFLALLLGLLGFVLLTALIPPGQSPDEPNHLFHAYILSDGHLLPQTLPGRSTGGYIDAVMPELYPLFNPRDLRGRVDAQTAQFKTLPWSGRPIYAEFSNTSYYFPAVYFPQALAMRIGRWAGWSFYASYHLARLLAFSSCAVLLLLAWRAYPIPAPALLVLTLPMMLFQAVAPTIDGITTALAVYALSQFSRLWKEEREASWGALLALCIPLLILVNSRANLVPLLALPLLLLGRQPPRRVLPATAATAALALVWTVTMVALVRDDGIRHPGYTQMQLLRHYAGHPGEVLRALKVTLIDPERLSFYGESFVGRLGWLDAPVPRAVCIFFAWALPAAALLALDLRTFVREPLRAFGLPAIAAASVLLTFLALLVQWSAFPAPFIDGVQGRYFIIPAIVLAYACTLQEGWRTWPARVLLAAALGISAAATASTVLARYYS